MDHILWAPEKRGLSVAAVRRKSTEIQTSLLLLAAAIRIRCTLENICLQRINKGDFTTDQVRSVDSFAYNDPQILKEKENTMPSFDIVSEIDMNQARNAVENAKRELETRFDFRGVDAKIELNKEHIELTAEADQQVMQLFDIFATKASKLQLDVSSFKIEKEDRHGKYITRHVSIKQGIDKEMAKKVVKLVKDSGIKVQVAIQGEELRVTGKKRDDLQEVMQLVRTSNLGQPFQFKNFRD